MTLNQSPFPMTTIFANTRFAFWGTQNASLAELERIIVQNGGSIERGKISSSVHFVLSSHTMSSVIDDPCNATIFGFASLSLSLLLNTIRRR
jgi:hypothetical protein